MDLAQPGPHACPLCHCANCAYTGLRGAVPLIGAYGQCFSLHQLCPLRRGQRLAQSTHEIGGTATRRRDWSRRYIVTDTVTRTV
jgi:hypothetical protein